MITLAGRPIPLAKVAVLEDLDDPRRLYERISDDIAALILDGTLPPNGAVPSARELAAIYGVSTMTAQRAKHELRRCRFTYTISGKGTFVHPDARTVAVLVRALRNPRFARDIAAYLWQHTEYADEISQASSIERRAGMACALLDHAEDNAPLLECLRYLWPDPLRDEDKGAEHW